MLFDLGFSTTEKWLELTGLLGIIEHLALECLPCCLDKTSLQPPCYFIRFTGYLNLDDSRCMCARVLFASMANRPFAWLMGHHRNVIQSIVTVVYLEKSVTVP